MKCPVHKCPNVAEAMRRGFCQKHYSILLPVAQSLFRQNKNQGMYLRDISFQELSKPERNRLFHEALYDILERQP